MTPTVVFDTFGNVAVETNNVVPAAYAVALVVMGFTAISYGKMVGVIPFTETIFLWQSIAMFVILLFISVAIAWASARASSSSRSVSAGRASSSASRISSGASRSATAATWASFWA